MGLFPCVLFHVTVMTREGNVFTTSHILLSIQETTGKCCVILAEQNEEDVHLGRESKFVNQFSLTFYRVRTVLPRTGALCSFFKKKYFIYLFSDRGEGKEKERERNINVWLPLSHSLLGTWPATQACVLTGNRTGNPLVHRPVLNPLSHTSQGYITLL